MYLIPLSLIFLVLSGCSTPKPQRVLTISEQIAEDTETAQNLFMDYQKKVNFVSFPSGERFLNGLAMKIATTPNGLSKEKVKVRIHRDDGNKNLARFFSFPGTTISIPLSFLKEVEYENQLAAAIAFEIANVMNRHLAKKMDQTENRELFGEKSLFSLDRTARQESIEIGTRLLYFSGYDLRGLASLFQRYPDYVLNAQTASNEGLESPQKEVEFNLREAQRAKSEYLPSLQPIVRSAEFITMKKGLKRL